MATLGVINYYCEHIYITNSSEMISVHGDCLASTGVLRLRWQIALTETLVVSNTKEPS